MCRYGRYDYFDYGYRYPRYNRSIDCCDLDLRPGDPIKVITGCVVKIGIFICTDGRLLTWVDNAGNKSFSPLNHITVTKLHGCGVYRCSDECSNDGCIVE
ncbi:hypothetical protein [Bacillus thuringiensis]|uniref:hypothetical protein n=1 Tax=Bacillus thuringiensis TaxID=1428 RepID=UPI000A38BA04|nr:hypothetical protein [Bacillus thuringiensis]OUA91686.1 hypothetical protein BK706_10835 [Bacillus thuringiensis serovar leesis]OUA91727.1 hypothetical protein BK706_10820 [Bacillus thuringiensis serovar leesis]OUA91732.1 hypothetical protein BK706_10815 [Bacillus thuringiensis serovar leesis]